MTTRYHALRQWLQHNNYPSFRFTQIMQAVFRHSIAAFDQMTTLPRDLRANLRAEFGPTILGIQPIAESSGDQATKTLFQLPDGHRVEAVAMQYRKGWESFCISSQSGCGLGCTFCATGKIGLKRNLTPTEITDQVLHYHLHGHNIDSISFMGMGEALANPNIFAAIDTFTDAELFALSPRRLTVSTVGVIPALQRLSHEYPQVNITFSLHSPFDGQRSTMIPLNKTYPLHDVFDVLDDHINRTHRKVYLAYLLIRDINDTDHHADEIVRILNDRSHTKHLYHVNLIRYNPAVGVTAAYQRPAETSVNHFAAELRRQGVSVTVRQSFGLEENAACGQLFARYDVPSVV